MRLLPTPIVALLFGLALSGCGGASEWEIQGKAPAPGADGKIIVESLEGGNQQVTVEFKHLPPPHRLGEDYKAYVVWFVPHGRAVQIAGVLAYDEEKRIGTLTTLTPFLDFSIIVTLEDRKEPMAPSALAILKKRVRSGT